MLGMSHLGVCVSNLDRSVQFYTQALGAEELDLIEMGKYLPTNYRDLLETPADTEGFSKFVALDGLLIELLYYTRNGLPGGHVGPAARRPMNQLGYTHLGIRVPDVGEFRNLPERIRKYGGHVVETSLLQIGEYDGQQIESLFVTDPDGTRIELMRIPAHFPIGGALYSPRKTQRA